MKIDQIELALDTGGSAWQLHPVSVFALWIVANLVALWLYCSIKGPFGVWIVLTSKINSGPILRVNASFLPRL